MATKHYTFQENQAMMPTKIIVVIVTLLVLLMGLFGYMYIAQEFLGKPVGENALPAPWALAIFIVTGLLTFYVSRLKIITRVTDDVLTMSLGVIGKRKFPLETIEAVKDYEGNPAADFLGYGYRIAIKQTGYIGRAEQAVTLKINGQKRELVITTEKPEELKQALQPKG
ncbi:DUF6141 family protein [Kangiella taiwanensis]|uniref:Uncharacterized protein n=1 Tax=Kangiella taiwanensis TaxID=1079179 RepID=A0ABP8I212_9GAMM|nr:DUF6141 family protein [Kangiella taiwanensis]